MKFEEETRNGHINTSEKKIENKVTKCQKTRVRLYVYLGNKNHFIVMTEMCKIIYSEKKKEERKEMFI